MSQEQSAPAPATRAEAVALLQMVWVELGKLRAANARLQV